MRDIDSDLRELKYKENIVIPENLRNKVNETYEKIEYKDTLKVKNYAKNIFRVACILIIIIFGINFVNPILAEEVPLLGPVVKVLNDAFGMNIRYTENGLAVNESFNTENFKVTIESVDYDNDQIFIFYKVERKNLEEGIYSLFLEVDGEGFTTTQEGAMATGDIQNGVYYGYSSMKVTFDDINEEYEEIELKLTPNYFGYITRDEEGEESIINSKEISLTIRAKEFR